MITESFTDGAWLCQPPLPSRDALTKPAVAHPPSTCFSWFQVRRQCGPVTDQRQSLCWENTSGGKCLRKLRQFLQKQRTVYKYIPESWGLGWPFFILLLRRCLQIIFQPKVKDNQAQKGIRHQWGAAETTGSRNRPVKTSDIELSDTDYNINMLPVFKYSKRIA